MPVDTLQVTPVPTSQHKENRYNLQFRVEAFNALNHTQFGGPNTKIQAGSSFGTITSTGVSARQVQLAAKFYF